jgi:hypothetical protein
MIDDTAAVVNSYTYDPYGNAFFGPDIPVVDPFGSWHMLFNFS